MRIAILDDYQQLAFRMADWTGIRRQHEVVVFDRHLSEDEGAVELQDFDILCTMRERMALPGSLLKRLPRLKLICITGPHHRTLDMRVAAQRGITVSHALSGARGTTSTPELAWGLIINLARHLPSEISAMKRGGWQNTCGRTLRGSTLGLVGLGRLGKSMVPIAQAFGMEVIAWSQNLSAEAALQAQATPVTKDELFRRSDFVSLHLVLGERTRHVVGAPELALMKPTAYLVNTARGGLVDSSALAAALRARTIAGAALDVFDEEPLPDGHALRSIDNLLLTPHLGYQVEETFQSFFAGTVENIEAFVSGQPIRITLD